MSDNDRQSKVTELEQLRERIAQIESDLGAAAAKPGWRATEFYTAYYATAGFMLGMFAAINSLLFNVVGATFVGKHPLELIRTYLTFPLGEKALALQGGVEDGIVLTIGCCLYIGTGMVLGMLFHLVLTRFTASSTVIVRLVVASVVAIAVWLLNFYGILNWLQPALFGGNWIVETIPPWVAALTHLVFGWTMALLYPLGLYTPYRLQTESS